MLLRPIHALALLLSALPLSAQTLTFTHVNVIDTVTGNIATDRTVVVNGNRIAKIAPSRKLSHPTGRIIDARGKYLIPGLWDMHTHVYYGKTAAQGTDLILPLFIANGVTGIRDMGSDLDKIVQARNEAAAHRLTAPRLWVSGPMLNGPGETYAGSIATTNATDAVKVVDTLLRHGADFIKIQSDMPRDAYFAAVTETKRLGKTFVGHVPDAVSASESVAAGQLSFEHLIGIFEASSPDEPTYLKSSYAKGTKKPGMFLATYDAAREAAIIRQLADHHVWQCPTLFWESGQWLADEVHYADDPDLAYAPASWTTAWPGFAKTLAHTMDTDPAPVREQFVTHELGIVRRLHAAGVPFLAGTDTPAGIDLIPGASLHRELERFVDAGFTPLQVLQTATLNPAVFLNRRADLGTVEQGKLADLLLLEANPLVDIRNTRKIAAVVADGQFYGTAELASLREQLKTWAAHK
ncbi:amidohydrolase, imidazolonepropionase [Terriglobus roseus DSM 18391]|uniref:Amidohydrolase, imidazolonepropionase n=1 Tax=Terriglobus roseus (strain DSM 18391 / NRRL B-41598 / KBS 63) TaxID=926566 RepID=I3ZAZ4_TERRK|nr:amidohydrolase family protein [Terriglobus roseus]AFL86412.1 amidohydrolase, imidazolonepropionase [Terriglobus roseus DSM 18391]